MWINPLLLIDMTSCLSLEEGRLFFFLMDYIFGTLWLSNEREDIKAGVHHQGNATCAA